MKPRYRYNYKSRGWFLVSGVGITCHNLFIRNPHWVKKVDPDGLSPAARYVLYHLPKYKEEIDTYNICGPRCIGCGMEDNYF